MRLPFRKPTKFTHLPHDPLMTEAKFRELEKELEKLKKIQPQAARDVARLAEMGDFSENVEYQLAKGRLRGINHAILKLEYQLNHASIIPQPKQNTTVQIGHTVTVVTGTKEKTYQILGSSETNPQKGIISHISPIGAAILGRTVGDTVTVKIGDKDVKYTILKTE